MDSVAEALEDRHSSHAAGAHLPLGMWDLPGPGIESMSPALASRFLTTELLGKPQRCTSILFLSTLFTVVFCGQEFLNL